MEWALAIIAVSVIAVVLCSNLLINTPVTPTMVFVAVGVLAGPLVLGDIDPSTKSTTVRSLANATLALVLFSDAARIDLRKLRTNWTLTGRLLGLGLPLTIGAGALAAVAIFPELSIAEALLLAIALAPTDAALGQAVITNPEVPDRIRDGLNVESGLNDGIATPLLLIVIAVAEAQAHKVSGSEALRIAVEQIGYGLLVGAGTGVLLAIAISQAERRKLIAGAWLPIATVAGAALAYGGAVPLGGSGFIAAFVAGATFGHFIHRDTQPLTAFTEDLGQLLDSVTFVVFGAVLLGPAIQHLHVSYVLYALASLTVVRMIPVAIALVGSRARAPTVAFVGWFGPRGLASIVFAVIIIEEANLSHESTIVSAIYVAIGLSVLLHGLTAAPLANRYARWFGAHPSGGRPEMERAATKLQRPRRPAHGPIRT